MSEDQCYICLEDETPEKQYATNPCQCTGSIKIHQLCLEILWDTTSNCGICKTPWNKPKKYRNGLELVEEYKDERKIVYTINTHGVKEGLYQSWWSNGKLCEQFNYKNGKEEGLYHVYHDNGQLYLQTNYVNGNREGLRQEWHYNGQLKEQSNYVNGKEEGLYQTWYENGQLRHQCNYVDGEIEGLNQCWSIDGELFNQSNYVSGVRIGVRIV